MNDDSHESDQVFRALSDPTRRAILALLAAEGEPTAGDIATQFPSIGRTAVSAHLRVLRDARLISEVRDGKHRRYRLGPNRAATAITFLQQIYAQSLPSDEPSARTAGQDGARRTGSV